jgi:aminoglycoside-2''-adenylyltransferase
VIQKLVAVPDQLTALRELSEVLPRHGVSYWLFGGWAVDFHVRRVTRPHGDIDIAIWSADRERMAALLLGLAWVHRPEANEDGYTCYGRDGIRLEIAFLARDERGQVYTPVRDGRGDWPADSFGDDVAELAGVRVRVVARDSLITEKAIVRGDPVTAAKDRADVVSLRHSGSRIEVRPPDEC